jgi:hypothetical protein
MKISESLTLLDRLIADMTKTRKNPLDLLVEHLNGARRYLLSNSTFEYRMSLVEAKKALDCISEKSDRLRLSASIRSLEDPSK